MKRLINQLEREKVCIKIVYSLIVERFLYEKINRSANLLRVGLKN